MFRFMYNSCLVSLVVFLCPLSVWYSCYLFVSLVSLVVFGLALSQDNVVGFLKAVKNGWMPSQAGAEAKENFDCMSWVGRTAATKLVKRICSKQDWINQNSILVCFLGMNGVPIVEVFSKE